jgi:hypothetical protein
MLLSYFICVQEFVFSDCVQHRLVILPPSPQLCQNGDISQENKSKGPSQMSRAGWGTTVTFLAKKSLVKNGVVVMQQPVIFCQSSG